MSANCHYRPTRPTGSPKSRQFHSKLLTKSQIIFLCIRTLLGKYYPKIKTVPDYLSGQNKCKVFVDPKGNDSKKYKGAYIISPNFNEFKNIVGDCKDQNSIIVKAKKLLTIKEELNEIKSKS